MAWTAAIALTQMGWLMAQSLTLRIHSPLSIALVRLLPPMLAALLVAVGAVWLERRDSSTLAAAALAGYAAGALWLVPVARAQDTDAASAVAPGAGDPRSERLKFIHTLSDVLVSTALAAHWSLVYGAAQAGCLQGLRGPYLGQRILQGQCSQREVALEALEDRVTPASMLYDAVAEAKATSVAMVWLPAVAVTVALALLIVPVKPVGCVSV